MYKVSIKKLVEAKNAKGEKWQPVEELEYDRITPAEQVFNRKVKEHLTGFDPEAPVSIAMTEIDFSTRQVLRIFQIR